MDKYNPLECILEELAAIDRTGRMETKVFVEKIAAQEMNKGDWDSLVEQLQGLCKRVSYSVWESELNQLSMNAQLNAFLLRFYGYPKTE